MSQGGVERITFLKFSGSNYKEWFESLRTQMLMAGVWSIVSNEEVGNAVGKKLSRSRKSKKRLSALSVNLLTATCLKNSLLLELQVVRCSK